MAAFDPKDFEFLVQTELQPNQFEPPPNPDRQRPTLLLANGLSEDDMVGRKEKAVDEWCSCGNCKKMPKDVENLCCKEIDEVRDRFLTGSQIQCVIEHPFFEPTCCNEYALQLSYNLMQKIKRMEIRRENNDRYRWTAYKNFVYTVYGKLEPEMRKVNPSCVVNAVRRKFPEETEMYTGFQQPPNNDF